MQYYLALDPEGFFGRAGELMTQYSKVIAVLVILAIVVGAVKVLGGAVAEMVGKFVVPIGVVVAVLLVVGYLAARGG